MPDSYDWQMARRVARLAAHSPGRGLPRWELIAAMGDAGSFDLWVRLAYARGWVDCVRDYVVAPALRPPPARLSWEGAAPVSRNAPARGPPAGSPRS